MTTSGTYNEMADFNIAQSIDEAYRRCRIDVSKIDAELTLSARISLGLMFIDWISDGVQQFAIDQQIEPLPASTDSLATSFVTPVGTVDIIDMVYRDALGQDIQIMPLSRQDYLYVTNKNISGQPISYFVDKTNLPPTVYLWAVQNIPGTSAVYNRIRQIQDVGTPTNTPDITVMYTEAMIAGLANKLWEKYGDDAKYPAQGSRLAANAAMTYERAKDGDRDRAPFVMKIRLGRRYNNGV